MSNIDKAKDALKLIEKGENPLDNYEMVKGALKESDEAIELLWSQLSPNMIEQLKKDKECKQIIKEHKKRIENEIKEVAKELITFKYKNTKEYDTWADKAKDTPLTRRTKFIYEIVWPIMADLFDKFFFEMSEMAESAKLTRTTKVCLECNNMMVYRKVKDKMVCTGCGINLKPDDVEGKQSKVIDAVAYDMMELPSPDSIARQMSGILDRAIDDYVKKEVKKRK